jgi:hypothetical protein
MEPANHLMPTNLDQICYKKVPSITNGRSNAAKAKQPDPFESGCCNLVFVLD